MLSKLPLRAVRLVSLEFYVALKLKALDRKKHHEWADK